MKLRTSLTSGCALFFVVSIVGCTNVAMTSDRSFQSQYDTARNALEKGDYTTANSAYLRLLSQAGPLDDRIKIELAHSYLRSGDFVKAIQTASTVAAGNTGAARSAALSVQGTAEHEIAMQLISKGDTKGGAARMKAAQKSIEEVLSNHPDLDPLGGLAGRQASIRVRLASLR